jgi:hypothetical protein
VRSKLFRFRTFYEFRIYLGKSLVLNIRAETRNRVEG